MASVVKGRYAELELWYNNADISDDIRDEVESFTYTDTAGEMCDSIEITINARDEKWIKSWWPQTGATLHPRIIGHNWNVENDRFEMDCGVFIMDSMEYSDAPGKIKMGGVAKPADTDFSDRDRGDVWQNTTLKNIAQTIADRYGLGLGFDGTDYEIAKREQNGPDGSFLQQLCSDYGQILKAYSNRLWIFDREVYKGKRAVQDVRRDNMIPGSFTWTQDLAGTYTGGEFSYTDPDKDADLTASVGSGKRILSLNQYASSLADAAAQLAAALNNENHKMIQMSFKVGGNFHLYAGGNVRIQKFSDNMDGKYYCETVTHTVTRSGGFETSVETVGIRDAFQSWMVGGSIEYHQQTASEVPEYESTYETTSPAANSANAAAAGSGGQAVQLNNCPLYVSSTAKTKANTVTGTYYLYDGILIAGRYRITNVASRCGKQPIGQNVTGWIDANQI